MKRARIVLLIVVAASLWLPSIHLFYAVDLTARQDVAETLAARRATASIAARAGTSRMRSVNPEWDFMQRTYTVLALANRAIAFPSERTRDLSAIDAVVGGPRAAAP